MKKSFILFGFFALICVSLSPSCSGNDQLSDRQRVAYLDSLSRTFSGSLSADTNISTLVLSEPTLVSADRSTVCIQLPKVIDGPSVRTFALTLTMRKDSVSAFSCKASSRSEELPTPVQTPPTGGTYIIQQGDTESSLRQRFGVNVKNPKKGNKITI